MSSVSSAHAPLALSFEFFPPKTMEGADKLARVRQELYQLKPTFCSVTYGAGGSTQEGTLQTIQAILAEGAQAAPHLSCIGAGEQQIRHQLQQFKAAGVRRIVAIRGDLPSGYGMSGNAKEAFRYSSDLIAFIRAETGQHFNLEVAAYPEVHPQAASPQADLQALVTKVQAGANGALTQYFFNFDAYARFIDDATQAGVFIPIVPGIMPITNSTQLLRFSERCGTEVPRWLRLRLQSFGDDRASIQALGLDVVTELCARLLDAGAPGLHFYTMNQAQTVKAICERLNLNRPTALPKSQNEPGYS